MVGGFSAQSSMVGVSSLIRFDGGDDKSTQFEIQNKINIVHCFHDLTIICRDWYGIANFQEGEIQ